MIKVFDIIDDTIALTTRIIKYPLRVICSKKGHDWVYHGVGWISDVKYPYICERFSCHSSSKIDDLKQNGFNGNIKIK